MNLRQPLTLLPLAVTIGAAAACGHAPEASPAPTPDSRPAVSVKVATVGPSEHADAIEVPGAVESSRQATVRSRLSATLLEMTVQEGDRVSPGAVLARLDGDAAQAALNAALATEATASRDLARANALLAKSAATKVEVDNAGTALARAAAAVTSAREGVSWATVRAPLAGRISRKVASTGDSVNPGAPLVEIEGDGGLEAVASVEASTVTSLRPGRRIEVRIDGVDQPVSATLRSIAPSADPSTHRFTLRAALGSMSGVRGGLFARLVLPGKPGATDRGPLVPQEAVFTRGGLTGVFVVREGRAWLRWIATGDATGRFIEARAGLATGEAVALDPSRLEDGIRVSEAR